jgi:2,5-diamino-6-(ribosylamino)-4(3H)-pyrimidinone 5'-phosphate reductase
VIRTFLDGASRARMVDTIIITVAPVIVGREGVGYGSMALENGEYIRTAQIGRDSVVGLRIR